MIGKALISQIFVLFHHLYSSHLYRYCNHLYDALGPKAFHSPESTTRIAVNIATIHISVSTHMAFILGEVCLHTTVPQLTQEQLRNV